MLLDILFRPIRAINFYFIFLNAERENEIPGAGALQRQILARNRAYSRYCRSRKHIKIRTKVVVV